MKIMKQTNSKRKIATIVLAVALVMGVATAFYAWQGDNTLNNEELTRAVDQTSTVQPEQVKDSSDKKDNGGAALPQKPSSQEGSSLDSGGNSQAGGDNTTNATGVTPEKPLVGRAEQSGNAIKVGASFRQQSTGYCELRLSKPGQQTITRTADIVVYPSYYACGFNVARGELPADGEWKATVLHYIGDASTASETKTIQVS